MAPHAASSVVRTDFQVTMVRSGRARSGLDRPSVLDLAAGHIYVPWFFFFPAPLSAVALRASLARVLVCYPEMAGRLVLDGRGECAIACSDAGVRFESARCRGAMPEYGPERPAHSDLRHYLDAPAFATPGRDQPLMIVRVSEFEDGGCVLAIAISHTLVDGTAFYAFLRAWQAEHHGHDYPAPAQSRAEVDALGESIADTHASPHFVVAGHLRFAHFIARYLWAKRQMQKIVVRYDAPRLRDMKAEAMDPLTGSGKWVSTNDVLSAHLWKALVAVRPPRGSGDETLVTLQSMRRIYDPPFDPHFMGNLVGEVSLRRRLEEVRDASLSELALGIREGFGHNDGTEMSHTIGFLNHQRDRGRLRRTLPKPILGLFGGGHVMVNDWSRFPMYEVDFGGGRPLWFDFPIVPLPWVAVLAPAVHDRGARDVHVAVPRGMMPALARSLSLSR